MGKHGSGTWGRFEKRLRHWALLASGGVAVLVLVLTVPDYSESWAAFHNEGLRGTFTTERTECGQRIGCTSYGTYVSDDGTVRRTDVFIDGGGADEGESVPAQWLGDKYEKVYQLDSRDLVWLVLIDIAAIAWLSWWTWRYLIGPLRRRTNAPRT